MIETTAVFKKCPDIRYRNVADEGIVIRQDAGEVLVLNGVGTRIMDLIADMSFGQLLQVLSEEYAVDRTTLEQDVTTYLQELKDAGVIDWADSRISP